MTLFCDSDWCLFNEDGFCERSRGSILGGMCDRYDDPEYTHLKEENAKLRELVLKNWYIALSEREALRAHDIDPDGGTYMAALDDEIATAKDRMRELGIEGGE